MNTYKYCHLCGAACLEGHTQPWKCSGCGNERFDNPRPTVDLALFNEEGQILISERAMEPAIGKFDLPGGFVEPKETLEEAVTREAHEELGLSADDYTTPIYSHSCISEYKYSEDHYDITAAIFYARILKPENIVAQDDAASVRFVSLDELDTIDFSIADYPDIIRTLHEKLCNLSST